jgi:hypothetical protein
MSDKEKNIEIFLQGEGIPEIQLIRVPHDSTLRDVVKAAQAGGAAITQGVEEVVIFIEDSDRELEIDIRLKDVGIGHRHRLHCHRCRQAEVTVNFNGMTKLHAFPPSKTIAKVKMWADDHFGLKGVDATEHALQICGTNSRPDEEVHIGALIHYPNCKLCFDLVPKKRVEG